MSSREDPPALPGAEVVAACTCLNLRKASRAVSHVYDEFQQPAGLRAAQFSLLMTVLREGTATMTGLAERHVYDLTTLSRNLKLLERDGLVQIAAGRDRRVREISLTDTGREAVERALPLWEQAQAYIKETLGLDQWQSLIAHLSRTASLTGPKREGLSRAEGERRRADNC